MAHGLAILPVIAFLAPVPPLRWVPLFAVLALAAYFFYRLIRAGLKYRGQRLVRCPDNCQDASVHIDLPHAAMTSVIGSSELRLDACSRWPEKEGCGQECLRELDATPQDCLIRNIVAKWYWGKRCAYCGQSAGDFQWPDFRSALLLPDGRTAEWQDIQPTGLHAVLEGAKPVCWKCHVAETFRREHPELVVDRPGDVVGPMGERRGSSGS